MHTFDPLCVFSSDLPGFDPATLNGMIPYYRLMTKWSGYDNSTELSWMGLLHLQYPGVRILTHYVWRVRVYQR
jgi:hypothetical protein